MFDRFRAECLDGNINTAEMIGADDDYPILPLFLELCQNNKFEVAKWLFQTKICDVTPQMHDIMYSAFEHACSKHQLEFAQWLFSINPNLIADNVVSLCCESYIYGGKSDLSKWLLSGTTYNLDCLLELACEHGDCEFAQWLFEKNTNMNISVYKLFECACWFDAIDTAKWVLQINPTINIFEDNRFLLIACVMDSIGIADWLVSTVYKSHPYIDCNITFHDELYTFSSFTGEIKNILINANLVDPISDLLA